jgi:hypothetical protein
MFSVDLFFKVFNFLYDNTDSSDLPYEVRQAAKNAQIETKDLFTNVIDQIAFNTADYNRLRSFVVDWYASLKTFQDIAKETTDAFSLPENLLVKALESFGFPYGVDVPGKYDKALFLYSLCELYKIKGTPLSIKTPLEFLGLTEVHIFEWWLKYSKRTDVLYLESKHIDLAASTDIEGLTFNQTLPSQIIPYGNAKLDEHWFYTESQIRQLNQTNVIRLPSITPYFSISAVSLMKVVWEIYSAIARAMDDLWQKFLINGTLDETDKDILVDLWGSNLSVLEVVLSIAYLYNTWTGRSATALPSARYLCYNGDPNPGYDVIVDEYNNVVQRPTSYDDREAKRLEFIQKFSRPQSQNFLQTVTDAGIKLNQINPELKVWLDSILTSGNEEFIVDTLKGFLRELDGYARINLKVAGATLENVLLGYDYDKLWRIVNFFKPKRARLYSVNLAYVVGDPLHESAMQKDDMFQRITHWFDNTYPHWEWLYDIGLHYDTSLPNTVYITDDMFMRIKMHFHTCLPRPSCRQMPYDSGGFYDTGYCCEPSECQSEITYDIGGTYDLPGAGLDDCINWRNYDDGGIYDLLESKSSNCVDTNCISDTIEIIVNELP